MALTCYSSAREAVDAVKAKEVSARELLDLHLERIEQANPQVNAIVSLDVDRARDQAMALDEQLAKGQSTGVLHALPFAFKDTHEVAGWRTTFGSPLKADYVPTRDDLIVERIRAAGVNVLGKTNVPEWAAGSHTFNPIFGVTRNPYDLTRSAGGSSGGAAAALAAGMVSLADGSDMGGSLRNPASFCNVVGLRPSVGRVPLWPSTNAWQLLGVSGPMARNVEDLALLLSVIAGPSDRAPLSLDTPGSAFAAALPPDALAGAKVALTVDLGGTIEVDRKVASVIEGVGPILESAGASVEQAHPSLSGADEAFRALRAWSFYDTFGKLLAEQPAGFKDSLADNIRSGAPLTGHDVAKAMRRMTMLAERIRRFFQSYDVLAMPVSQVPPFSADDEYPHVINGRAQETYLDWMRSAYLISATGCPAISVPAGFTAEGLPVGLQLITAPRTDRRLLEYAYAFEQATRVADRRPDLGGAA